MKKIKKNENGFSVIELLLLLIFIAIVAFIGVYVAHNHKSSQTVTSDKTSAQAASRAVTIADDLLGAGMEGNAGLVSYVNKAAKDTFTSSFKTAVDRRTALPNEDASPIACTNGIFPTSFGAGSTWLSGNTAIVNLKMLSNGSDYTNKYDQIPQVTLSYLNNNWLIDNYNCIANPAIPITSD
jgi:type II secretory pathway pseudopilin PulG